MNEEIKKAKKVGALMMWGWEFCMFSGLSCKLLRLSTLALSSTCVYWCLTGATLSCCTWQLSSRSFSKKAICTFMHPPLDSFVNKHAGL